MTSGQAVVQHGEEQEEVVQAGQHYQQVVEGVPVGSILYLVQHTKCIVQCMLIF